MKEDHAKRLALLRDLLAMTNPLNEVVGQLSAMGGDFEGRGVELTKAHIASALQRYLNGELSEGEIESWANAVEGRDGIHSEETSEGVIEEVLHELANPLLTYPLTYSRARQLVDNLASTR